MAERLARRVVVAEAAGPAAWSAARELRDALRRVGAPELPVGPDPGGSEPAFVVGAPPPGASEPAAADACRVARRGDRLYLWGQGPRGALHAVYAYLQDVLGFRWLTAELELRPPLAAPAALPDLELEQAPAFAVRDVGYHEARQAPWSARLRLNGEFSAGRRDPAWGGGVRYTHFVHTFYDLVPPERYFAEHPEYFALVDGRRRAALAQLCLTQPAIVDIAAERVRAWFDADPAAALASVSQNDWLGACECPPCRALVEREGSQVGPVLHFVNAVARAVGRTHPGRLIDTLAYWYTEDPPRHLRPEPNVAVRLCHMSPSCESHAVEACPRNAPFAARLRGWAAIAPRLHVWDYETNFSHYLLPFPNFAAIAADLALFRRHGVESVFCQGDLAEGGGGEWAALRAYYLARLLWDVRADPEALIAEFLRGVFPRAYSPVRAYFDLIQARAADPDLHLRMFSPVQAGHLTPEVLAGAEAALHWAQVDAAGDAREEAEVGRLRLSVDYARLALPPDFQLAQDVLVPLDPPAGEGLEPDRRPEALEAFLAELGRHGVRQLAEARPLEEFRARVRTLSLPHAAPPWAAGDWVLRVVPDLGGRLWEASFAGRPLLAPAASEDGDYPAARGYEESCAGDLGRTAPFALAAAPPGEPLVLTATLAGLASWHPYAGIEVRRAIAPAPDGGLHLRTTVTNADASPHPLALRPRLCLRGPLADLCWRDGAGAWRPAGAIAADGGPLRAALGECGWRLRLGDVVLECLYGAVDRLEVVPTPWGARIQADGGELVVPPGGCRTLEQTWRARVGGG